MRGTSEDTPKEVGTGEEPVLSLKIARDMVEQEGDQVEKPSFSCSPGVKTKWSLHIAPAFSYVMRSKVLPVMWLAAVIMAAGCKRSQDTAANEQITKIEAETKDASAKMQAYTYAQKDQFVADMQAQLAELNQDLDKLGTDINNASDQVKAEAQPKLQALRDQADQLKQQLDQVKNADESTWDNVKTSFNDAYDKAKDSFNDAREWLSQKIAPQ